MRIIDSLVDSIPHLFNRNEIRDEIGMINYSIGPSWSVGPVQRFREGARWEAESWLVTRYPACGVQRACTVYVIRQEKWGNAAST